LRKKFEEELSSGVRLLLFTQEIECDYCEVTRRMLEELVEINGLLELEVHYLEHEGGLAEKWRIDKIPATILLGERDMWVRFFGVPSGYEFPTLIEDIIDVSRGRSRLSPKSVDLVRSIERPIHVEVLVTPTCPYCPRAVRVAHQMAIESQRVVADMVEIIEYPHLAQKYQVMAVPTIVVNGKVAFTGALPENRFIENVIEAAGKS